MIIINPSAPNNHSPNHQFHDGVFPYNFALENIKVSPLFQIPPPCKGLSVSLPVIAATRSGYILLE
jgi:hypothetical protein